jgi:hypothetical protein
MAIVIRSRGGKWEKTEKVVFVDEAQLQKMLYASPELIPTRTEDHVAVFTRESGLPGSGYTDLIGVDAQGNILIIETKLARNGEIRRKVIGQVLEYAAYLWEMSFEDFDRFFVIREGKSLLELLSEKDSSLDMGQIRQKVEENLASGNFQLVIAVDGMNPELEKIIAYVASRSAGLQLEALELDLYRCDQTEVLVPRRYGQLNQPAVSGSGKRTLTFEEILQSCPDDHSRDLFGYLAERWIQLGNTVKPGTVGASFQSQIGDRAQPIFWAYPDSVQNGFSDTLKRGVPDDAIQEYRAAVAKLEGFSHEEILTKSQPITKFSALRKEAIAAFLDASQKCVKSWRASIASPSS